MTRDEALCLVTAAFHEVAPDVDVSALDPGLPLHEEVDIDSMDFLNLVGGVQERAGIEVPPSDYAMVSTLGGLVDYLVSATPARG